MITEDMTMITAGNPEPGRTPIRNISACGNITRIEEAMSRMILYMAPTFPTGRETVGSIRSPQEFDSSGGFHTSIEDTPYGVSKMRQQRQSAAEEIDEP